VRLLSGKSIEIGIESLYRKMSSMLDCIENTGTGRASEGEQLQWSEDFMSLL
jgi:hypothetical protein